jgi:hypothetical protein
LSSSIQSSFAVYLITDRHNVSSYRSNTVSYIFSFKFVTHNPKALLSFQEERFYISIFLIRKTSKSRLGDEGGIFDRATLETVKVSIM